MVPIPEATGAIFGAWRLARLDPHGLSYFNATETGFWRSFFAALLTAPVYILMVALDYAQQPLAASDGEGRIVIVHAIAYAISWTAFPLAMATVARLIDRQRHYIRYIVAHNWGNVLEMALFLPVTVVAASGVPQLVVLPAVAMLLIFAYRWYVTRTALEITGFQAMAIVGVDLALDIALMMAMHGLLPDGPI